MWCVLFPGHCLWKLSRGLYCAWYSGLPPWLYIAWSLRMASAIFSPTPAYFLVTSILTLPSQNSWTHIVVMVPVSPNLNQSAQHQESSGLNLATDVVMLAIYSLENNVGCGFVLAWTRPLTRFGGLRRLSAAFQRRKKTRCAFNAARLPSKRSCVTKTSLDWWPLLSHTPSLMSAVLCCDV